jgi:hypothetical protein
MKSKINKEGLHSINTSTNIGPPARSTARHQTGEGTRAIPASHIEFSTPNNWGNFGGERNNKFAFYNKSFKILKSFIFFGSISNIIIYFILLLSFFWFGFTALQHNFSYMVSKQEKLILANLGCYTRGQKHLTCWN